MSLTWKHFSLQLSNFFSGKKVQSKHSEEHLVATILCHLPSSMAVWLSVSTVCPLPKLNLNWACPCSVTPNIRKSLAMEWPPVQNIRPGADPFSNRTRMLMLFELPNRLWKECVVFKVDANRKTSTKFWLKKHTFASFRGRKILGSRLHQKRAEPVTRIFP